jgi:hypothetical protein
LSQDVAASLRKVASEAAGKFRPAAAAAEPAKKKTAAVA